MSRPQHTPGPWRLVQSFNGWVVVRAWSDGWYQRMRAPHLRTEDEARAYLADRVYAALYPDAAPANAARPLAVTMSSGSPRNE